MKLDSVSKENKHTWCCINRRWTAMPHHDRRLFKLSDGDSRYCTICRGVALLGLVFVLRPIAYHRRHRNRGGSRPPKAQPGWSHGNDSGVFNVWLLSKFAGQRGHAGGLAATQERPHCWRFRAGGPSATHDFRRFTDEATSKEARLRTCTALHQRVPSYFLKCPTGESFAACAVAAEGRWRQTFSGDEQSPGDVATATR